MLCGHKLPVIDEPPKARLYPVPEPPKIRGSTIVTRPARRPEPDSIAMGTREARYGDCPVCLDELIELRGSLEQMIDETIASSMPLPEPWYASGGVIRMTTREHDRMRSMLARAKALKRLIEQDQRAMEVETYIAARDPDPSRDRTGAAAQPKVPDRG